MVNHPLDTSRLSPATLQALLNAQQQSLHSQGLGAGSGSNGGYGVNDRLSPMPPSQYGSSAGTQQGPVSPGALSEQLLLDQLHLQQLHAMQQLQNAYASTSPQAGYSGLTPQPDSARTPPFQPFS
jgi:hypothetical protein